MQLKSCVQRYGLAPYIRFKTRFCEAAWNESAGHWRISAGKRSLDNGNLDDALRVVEDARELAGPVPLSAFCLYELSKLSEGLAVVLGAVDARNTRLETPDEVARLAEGALRLVSPDRLWLAPTTSLEYLPRDVARAKLAALVAGAKSAGGVEA